MKDDRKAKKMKNRDLRRNISDYRKNRGAGKNARGAESKKKKQKKRKKKEPVSDRLVRGEEGGPPPNNPNNRLLGGKRRGTQSKRGRQGH